MRLLFVHQNFPGQFKYLLGILAADPRNEIVGIGEDANVRRIRPPHPGLRIQTYPRPKAGSPGTHPYLREMEGHLRRGQQVYRSASKLLAGGFKPDVVIAHPGWGEAMFLHELFPDARHIHYCEFFYHAQGADLGFDPEFPVSLDARLLTHVRNSTQLLGLVHCHAGVSPTPWQRSLYPAEYQEKIRIIHEGIDTGMFRPNPAAALEWNGLTFRAGEEIVTFASRNLEPYRGFHQFMRSLPHLQALRPNARFLIAGGDQVNYGQKLPDGDTYRQRYSAEIDGQVDWSRIHFLGHLPHASYLTLLQISCAHVYLSYPFVLSWSMLQAMACECLVVGSATPTVMDAITDGETGLLVDFFDPDALARRVAQALESPQAFAHVRRQAREFIIRHYDLHRCCLPEWTRLLTAA